VNKQYDANVSVDRRETSSLLISTFSITGTFNMTFSVIQEHKLHKLQTNKTTIYYETTIKLLHRIKHWL